MAELERLLCDYGAYATMANAVSPYGDGHAAERIVKLILEQRLQRSNGAVGKRQ